MGKNVYDLELGSDFLDMILQVQATKDKIGLWQLGISVG